MYRTALHDGFNKKVINNSILHKGIYIYHIEAEGVIQLTRKLIKMK